MQADRAEQLPTRIGILQDYPSADGGAAFETALRLGLEAGRGSAVPDIEVISRSVTSPRDVDGLVAAYRGLVADGVIAIAGPAISDSAVAVVPVAEELGVPCINFSGSEQSRGEFAFHYQVGSLEDEPYVLARHLATRGLNEVSVVHDRSFIGEQYAAFFIDAAQRAGIEITATIGLEPDGSDANAVDSASSVVAYFGLGMSAYPLVRALPSHVTVVANSALMFGYAMPDWARAWEGWTYVDAVHEANPVFEALRRRWTGELPAGPTLPCAHDIGRLIGKALTLAPQLDGEGLRLGLEAVKQLPAALGAPGTTMGFGRWERGALKGEFLVLRQWRSGKSVLWR
jgi:ABC-type branched-subunit amino acid transport system substrate-binding protein